MKTKKIPSKKEATKGHKPRRLAPVPGSALPAAATTTAWAAQCVSDCKGWDMWESFPARNGSLAVDAIGNVRLWMPNDTGDGKAPMELRAECNHARRKGRGNWRPVEVSILLQTVTPNAKAQTPPDSGTKNHG